MTKVLFIGGTGIISSACAPEALGRGMDVTFLNRGSSFRPAPQGARLLAGDIRNPASVHQVLKDEQFDVVVEWVAYTPKHVQTDLELFKGRTNQYIFISSASAYHKPVTSLPITESTPLHNPWWQYSRDKIACEDLLMAAYRSDGFPITIVRPSHTYDKYTLPILGDYTTLERMRQGKKVIIHGDGTSLWTLTHHKDFAKAFTGLLGNPRAIGEAYHITSDESLTWNQIFAMLADALGVSLDAVHMSSEFINAYLPEDGPGLLGDKAHSVIFDNTKIKRLVPDYVASIPFVQGAREMVAWFLQNRDKVTIDQALDQRFEEMIAAYESSLPH